jgi:hypothetical protein
MGLGDRPSFTRKGYTHDPPFSDLNQKGSTRFDTSFGVLDATSVDPDSAL